jgi:hypothetical protein
LAVVSLGSCISLFWMEAFLSRSFPKEQWSQLNRFSDLVLYSTKSLDHFSQLEDAFVEYML